MVEVAEFSYLSTRYQVYGVPRTVINDVIRVGRDVFETALVMDLMKVRDENETGILRKQWEIGLN